MPYCIAYGCDNDTHDAPVKSFSPVAAEEASSVKAGDY